MFKKPDKFFFIYFLISVSIFSFIFRDHIINISTNLIDWRDYAYVVWVINQAINNFKELGSNGIFNGNAFYPNENILLFSDLLWPQTLITTIFKLFSKNIILQFNLTFFTTILLNIVSIYLFWKTIFKKKQSVLFASILTNFSPFFFLQLSHFQMISYWPFFFALSFLFKNKKTIKETFLIGLFLSIQFYAAVYWSIFLITVIGIYYFVKLIKKDQIVDNTKSLILIGMIFIILAGPILFKYLQNQKAYSIHRNYSEYVEYSAQISDYFFSNSYNSAVSNSKLFKKINSFNNHPGGERAGSPSVLITFLFLIGIAVIKKNKKEWSINFSIKEKDLFFILLALIGLIFSLGPRLLFNGNYLAVPLPFSLALKYLIIFDPIRATARFSALFYIGAFYFATKGLERINKKNNIILISILCLIYLLELLPLNLKSEYNNYYSHPYALIEKDCSKGAVLLEYPFDQNFEEANVITNLKYKASQLTASVKSTCDLVNGYAGFDPDDYTNYIATFNKYLNSTDSAKLQQTIAEKNVSFIKINKKDLSQESMKKINNIEMINNFGKTMFEDNNYLLIETNLNEAK